MDGSADGCEDYAAGASAPPIELRPTETLMVDVRRGGSGNVRVNIGTESRPERARKKKLRLCVLLIAGVGCVGLSIAQYIRGQHGDAVNIGGFLSTIIALGLRYL